MSDGSKAEATVGGAADIVTTTPAGKGPIEVVAKPAKPAKDESKMRLVYLNPHDVIIGGLDVVIDESDPLFDERAGLSDADADIDGIAASISATDDAVIVDGVLRGDKVWIKKGRRRTRGTRRVHDARKKKGLPPPVYGVLVSAETDAATTRLSVFAENYNRMDTPELLQAQAMRRLMAQDGYDHRKLAAVTNKTVQSVKNILSLLNLAEPIQRKVANGTLGPAAAYKIAEIFTPVKAPRIDPKASDAEKAKAIEAHKALVEKAIAEDHKNQLMALAEAEASAKAHAKANNKSSDKVRGTDVKLAVPAVKAAAKANIDPAFTEPAKSKKGKKDGKKKPKAPAPSSTKFEAPTAGMIRRVLKRIDAGIQAKKDLDKGEMDKETYANLADTIKIDDPDLREFGAAMAGLDEDKVPNVVNLLRVLAGEISVGSSKVPGLKKCLVYCGCKLGKAE